MAESYFLCGGRLSQQKSAVGCSCNNNYWQKLLTWRTTLDKLYMCCCY